MVILVTVFRLISNRVDNSLIRLSNISRVLEHASVRGFETGASCVGIDPPLKVSKCSYIDTSGDLIQIVTNLVQNAVKFPPEGGSIIVTVRQENQILAGVSVRDTGPGILPEFLEQIFDPFF